MLSLVFLGQQPPMEEQGMCYDGIFRGGTGPKSHVVAFFGPRCAQGSTPSLFPQVPWLDLIGDTCLACHNHKPSCCLRFHFHVV